MLPCQLGYDKGDLSVELWHLLSSGTLYLGLNKSFSYQQAIMREKRAWRTIFSFHISVSKRKDGRNLVLRRFQQLRSYRDEIETRHREEIHYSSRLVPRGLSVAEGL